MLLIFFVSLNLFQIIFKMKKSTVTIFIFFTLLGFAKAQIQKGTYTMRPSLRISEFGGRVLGTSANNNPLSISMGMNYGKFVTDKLLISGGVSGGWSNRAVILQRQKNY